MRPLQAFKEEKIRRRAECGCDVFSAQTGLARQQALAGQLAVDFAAPLLTAWRCRPALLVSRSETRLPRFERAVSELQAAGWPVVTRGSGGRACPVGTGTLQVATIEAAVPAATMNAKYAALAKLIQTALGRFQIDARIGAVAAAYCPGRYDLAVQGKKIVGMSQHWFRNRHGVHCAVTAASINLDEPPDLLADAVNTFYDVAGSDIRCRADSLTNMRRCDGAAGIAGRDLVSAVVSRLESDAKTLGMSAGNDFDFGRLVTDSVCIVGPKRATPPRN